MNNSGNGPLFQMRVLDLSQQLPGPYATQLLASLGARVTKIEPPSGDAGRHLDAAMFNNVNAGKESITLDLKTETGKQALYDLVPSYDVFIEGFRPGVTNRLGCDYNTLKQVHPDLVYCSISGFGQSGPLSTRPSHDISLQSMAGALPENSVSDRIGVPWVDLATGTSAAFAITALWHQGEGGYLDISMLDSALAWSRVKPEAINSLEPTYGTVKTKDGKLIVIAILEDAMWNRLCIGLQWDDWTSKKDFLHYEDRRKHAQEIRLRLDETVAQLTASQLIKLAIENDLPIEMINSEDDDAKSQVQLRSGGHPCIPLPVDLQQNLGPAPELK
jgi:crotonobetainyl-CoA:carnitine CoA-transferase CaiB-like acyl-CoA transferase